VLTSASDELSQPQTSATDLESCDIYKNDYSGSRGRCLEMVRPA
jgi:hypothetical protein